MQHPLAHIQVHLLQRGHADRDLWARAALARLHRSFPGQSHHPPHAPSGPNYAAIPALPDVRHAEGAAEADQDDGQLL